MKWVVKGYFMGKLCGNLEQEGPYFVVSGRRMLLESLCEAPKRGAF